MKKIRNFLPVEFYFLLLPAIFLFLFSLLWLQNPSINAFGVGAFLENSFDISANSPIGMPVITLILILFFGLLVALSGIVIKNNRAAINWKYFLSIFLIILFIFAVAYSLALFTSLLFKIAGPARTAQFGYVAMSWDRTIFKTDPGIWMINRFGGTFFESVLLWVYNSIFFILYFVLLASFIFNKKSFRRLVISFFISWIIALPLWFLFPTLSPDLMFRQNGLKMAKTEEIKTFNNFNPGIQLKKNLDFQEKVHLINPDPSKRLLPTSTFPSMHAAWGVITAYSAMTISPWLGIVFVPWAILNGIGSVYILEHFAVDIFFGTFIALLSIIITEILLRFENKYFEDKFGLFLGFDYVRIMFKNISAAIQGLIK